jgi:3-oxoacyl-[acyl-carrier protein] reductase
VLVTGGTKGIGLATALAFANAGARVLACHRSADKEAESLARELKTLGEDHLVARADVTSRPDVRRLAELVHETWGGLDVLVNNVGVDGGVPFAEIDDAEWERLLAHNVTAAYLVTQGVLGELADGASVVNVGSSVALRGRVNGVHYTASKAAIIGFTRGLCKELGPRGIRVNTVAPGLTETEPGAGLPAHAVERIVGMTALGRICQPEDVAGAVLFLAGDTSRYISGVTLNVDGGV